MTSAKSIRRCVSEWKRTLSFNGPVCGRLSKLIVFCSLAFLLFSDQLHLVHQLRRLDSSLQTFGGDDSSVEKAALDPCTGRPTPPRLSNTSLSPPTLYFLHIPKTAGTLMYQLVLQYAHKTNGLACQFLFDGNRHNAEEYSMSIIPPPSFPTGSLERRAVDAWQSKNKTQKLALYRQGACRSVRGHVTYAQRDVVETPVVSLTVLRNPLERIISMYEFVRMMVRTRPGQTGWDRWISASSFEAELDNSSSILNHGFYGPDGAWIALDNIGFSFHFYGVLHQLSGINPIFEGVRQISSFRIANAARMAEKAKDNICSTHILGVQSDIPDAMSIFFERLAPYAQWSEREQQNMKGMVTNRNSARESRDIGFHLTDKARNTLEKRLQHEIEVYQFAQSVIEFRASQRQSDVQNKSDSSSRNRGID